MTPDLPARLRALAEHQRISDPDAEWQRFCARNGGAIPPNVDGRWGKWLAHAKKVPRETPAPVKTWQAPPDWECPQNLTTEQWAGIQEALATGRVWMPCGCVIDPVPRGARAICPAHLVGNHARV